ncbi:hypothetical protein [Jannaschia sp. W003]|uniref:hypothetical protein n=1 Tax=Jannaschia sp. W003 TaxID=2867012 RepID=UPI0021A810E1|nr:hypothetical protein [Jannaschia sp. W003]UWQ22405.1 hypothetical protein K3554_05065 [Jannaschia sp. W003]
MQAIRSILLAASAALALEAAPAAAEVALVMGEEAGCIWCQRWREEVGGEYPLTAEGRAAPLRRVDIHEPVPDDRALEGPIRITPTFVLVRDGAEIDRFEGYPGEDFFWPVLGAMLDRAAEGGAAELDGWREAR